MARPKDRIESASVVSDRRSKFATGGLWVRIDCSCARKRACVEATSMLPARREAPLRIGEPCTFERGCASGRLSKVSSLSVLQVRRPSGQLLHAHVRFLQRGNSLSSDTVHLLGCPVSDVKQPQPSRTRPSFFTLLLTNVFRCR